MASAVTKRAFRSVTRPTPATGDSIAEPLPLTIPSNQATGDMYIPICSGGWCLLDAGEMMSCVSIALFQLLQVFTILHSATYLRYIPHFIIPILSDIVCHCESRDYAARLLSTITSLRLRTKDT